MKPVKARGLVDQLQGIYQVSIRRACDVLRFQKSSYFYKARRPSQAALRKRIQGLVGGTGGCAQLFDLTSDLLKMLALTS